MTRRKVGATSALPDDAFRVRLTPGPVPDSVTPGQHVTVDVAVTNLGPHVLPAGGKDGWFQVTVGNHWLDARGKRIVNDDGRAELPQDIEPGQTVEVVLDVEVPDRPGPLKLELDCVQEAVAWFGDRGSSTMIVEMSSAAPKRGWLRRPGRKPAEPAHPVGHDVEEATMQMHGVPDELMQSWITQSGGRVIDAMSWETLTGIHSPDWDRRIYLVGRSS
ncbi:MAG: hypothetical protein JO147_00445 [Actinobacteria bacterium]|nr:hypothetical protein [Actinomycetota bacterium]